MERRLGQPAPAVLPDESCARNACGDTTGGCEQRPTICPSSLDLACGCDGVTYWNDCLRQRDGVAASTPGACASCGGVGGQSCPAADASCAQLVYGSQTCPAGFPGACWAAPRHVPEPVSARPAVAGLRRPALLRGRVHRDPRR